MLVDSIVRSAYTRSIERVAKRIGVHNRLLRMYYRFTISRYDTPLPGYSEPNVMHHVWNAVDSGDVFWDVGAKSGTYSKIVSFATHPAGIVAFEPNPLFFEQLERTMGQLPGSFFTQALDSALGAQEAVKPLSVTTPEGSQSSSGALLTEKLQSRYDGVKAVNVRVLSGDNAVTRFNVPPPSVIKIDVEGAEYEVLQGLSNTLENGTIHTIFIEIHESQADNGPSIYDFDASPEDVHAFLEDHGYSHEVIENRARDYHIMATRRKQQTGA